MGHHCKKHQIYLLEGKDKIKQDEVVEVDDNNQGDDISKEPLIFGS